MGARILEAKEIKRATCPGGPSLGAFALGRAENDLDSLMGDPSQLPQQIQTDLLPPILYSRNKLLAAPNIMGQLFLSHQSVSATLLNFRNHTTVKVAQFNR